DDNLVFPAGASQTTNSDDFVAGTRFRSIEISGNYTLQGNNSVTLLEGVTFNAPTGAATVSIPLSLGASASIFSANVGATLTLGKIDLGNQQTLTTDGRGNINVSDIVSGTGGSGITKFGDGTLTLGGANTFDGPVNVNQGNLLLTNSSALGSTAAGTF